MITQNVSYKSMPSVDLLAAKPSTTPEPSPSPTQTPKRITNMPGVRRAWVEKGYEVDRASSSSEDNNLMSKVGKPALGYVKAQCKDLWEIATNPLDNGAHDDDKTMATGMGAALVFGAALLLKRV